MNQNAPTVVGAHARSRSLGFTLSFIGGVTLALALLALLVLSPALFPSHGAGLRLGLDLPMQVLKEPPGGLTPAQVAALPDTAFTRMEHRFNQGYTRDSYWFRIDVPALASTEPLSSQNGLWLELMPSYLDRVTLYQRDASGRWHEIASGDTVPMSQRIPVRQLLFPLRDAQPMLLRIQSTSPLQFVGTVRRSADLIAHFSHDEWSSGLHQGVSLALTLLIAGAALLLRMRKLVAMTAAAAATYLHGAVDRGYLQVWWPEAPVHWGDLAVSVGTLTLPAVLAWQAREIMTWGTPWRRIDKAVIVLGVAPLLCLPSIALDRYPDWAWVGIVSPWLIVMLWSVLAWINLLRQGATLANVLMVGPSTLIVTLGAYIAGVYLGWAQLPEMEMSLLWQFTTLLVNILVTLAVGAGLVEKFRQSSARQAELIGQLKRSELVLEERVRQRTAELLTAQNSLQATLHQERKLRQQQRRFVDMVQHEFRTPLAVIDSAAAEQLTFPAPDLDAQIARATQIRRACRRLTMLLENSLSSDRLDSDAFRLQLQPTRVVDLVADAAQIAHWSRRHQAHLELAQAPASWECDSMLLRIALSNLVDNAARHAKPGRIGISAQADARGHLLLSVCDEGPGLTPSAREQVFERGYRGNSRSSGFGIGLWVTRHIARLHGGDIRVTDSGEGGTCFTIDLPAPASRSAGLSTMPRTPWPPAVMPSP